MTRNNPGDDARTEIIHDVDYPLDVPDSSGPSAAGTGPPSRGSADRHTAGVSSGSTAIPSDTASTGAGPAGDSWSPPEAATEVFAMPATSDGTSERAGGASPATTAFPAPYPSIDSTGEIEPLPFGDEPAVIEPSQQSDKYQRGTIDFGLMLLRLAIGGILALHGLQKLFGVFGGTGIDGFATILADAGFRSSTVLAVTGGVVELVAGFMVVVGLATPLATAALLSMGGLGIAVELTGPEPLDFTSPTGSGLEAQIMFAAALMTLLFTGPGRWSADRRWRWAYEPRFSGAVWLLVSILLAVAVWYLLNGSNPLASTQNSEPVTTS